MQSQERRLADLLEVVNHEEDVGVAHLGLLPFAVHGVLAGRRKHFLSNTAERFRQTAGWRARGLGAGRGVFLPDTSSYGCGCPRRLSVCRRRTSPRSPAGRQEMHNQTSVVTTQTLRQTLLLVSY